MTRITGENLFNLLPAVHRLRDANEGGPLEALMAVLAREGAVLEENIEQLLDDLFIETGSDWAVPYVAGVVGYSALHEIDATRFAPRAEAANTISYRRRKGTAAVLEQLARDVTGWPARVVEYFQLVATCQHMNHIRPEHHWSPDLGAVLPLEDLGQAFDSATRTVDVRSIADTGGRKSVGGRHNFANIGIFLWRLDATPLTNGPTTRVDERRFLFDSLGAPRQLVNRPQAEETITSLAEPVNVAGEISRRALDADIALFYGRDGSDVLRSFEITVDDVALPITRIEACDLSNIASGWNHSPHGAIDALELAEIEDAPGPEVPPANALVRVDPMLGRIAFPEPQLGEVRVSFHTAFPAPIGGGEYDRAGGLAAPTATRPLIALPHPLHATVQAAIEALPSTGGIVEIRTNDVFAAPTLIEAVAGGAIELRASDGVRPVLRATEPLVITGGDDARVDLSGLVLEGDQLEIRLDPDGASVGAVRLSDVTLIPGHVYTPDGLPALPGATSLECTAVGVELTLERSISGPLRMVDTTNLEMIDSIVDAAALDSIDSAEGLAIAGPAGEDDPGGALTIIASTVVGRVVARSFPLVSNSILYARSANGIGAPVSARRRQEGCMRFSFVPHESITPRRFRCQPQLAIDQAIADRERETNTTATAAERAFLTARVLRWLVPSFTALTSSAPAYMQLRRSAPVEIQTGASDESEMGVYHQLFAPQRIANLRIRLDEYLRFGLQAGLVFET